MSEYYKNCEELKKDANTWAYKAGLAVARVKRAIRERKKNENRRSYKNKK